MKIYFLPMLLSLFFLGACDKNDEIIPEDADENFITSVVMTVDGKSYTADITDNTVTITVPFQREVVCQQRAEMVDLRIYIFQLTGSERIGFR